MNQWLSDITNYKLITRDKIRFAFEEVSKCHQYTINSAKILDDKSLLTLGGLITISTAIAGFLVAQCSFDKSILAQRWEILLPVFVLLVMFWHAGYLLVKAIYPVKYYPPGNDPKMILTQDQFDQPLNWLMFSQAHNMQERIATNSSLNDQKAEALKRALSIAITAPIVSIITFGLIQASPAVLRIATLWIWRLS